jgi:hypothetical protein
MTPRHRSRGWLLALALTVAAGQAQAQSGSLGAPDEPEGPWSTGVSQQRREAADQAFLRGNTLLKDGMFAQALGQYREALKHWDHPGIHYNMVLALLNLDQPIEILHHIEEAMRHGPPPLDEDKYEQARVYRTLVQNQLARISVECEVPGAQVVMDGKPLFVAPGRYQGWVRPGPHTIVASAQGYLTAEASPALAPGDEKSVTLRLFRTEDLTQYRRAFAVWVPWTVMGAGLASGLLGGGLHWGARTQFDAFDREVASCGPEGCRPGPGVLDRYDRGHLLQNVAVGAYTLGGAALAAGTILLIVNRPEAVQVTPQDLQRGSFQLSPVLGSTPGLSATFQF